MIDLFVEYIDPNTIVICDAERCELWRGDVSALEVLRALREYGAIGLYEDDEMPEEGITQ